MPDREHFEHLAMLVASGEASLDEQAELDAALAADSELAAEVRELAAVDEALRAAAQSPPKATITLPAHVISFLEQARRDARAGGEAAVIPFESGPPSPSTPMEVKATRRKLPVWLALAACAALLLGLSTILFSHRPKTGAPIVALAPRGTTSHTQPTLVWDGQPGQHYDVWILPPEGSYVDVPALFTAKGVVPPVAFAQLDPGAAASGRELASGQDYRLLICIADTGRLAGTASMFRTAASAAGLPVPGSLAKARQLAESGRVGDALMLLATLPVAEHDTPEAKALGAELRAKLARNQER